MSRPHMKLANLLTADAVSDARFAALDVRGISADSRAIEAGRSVRGGGGRQGRRPALRRAGARRGRGRGDGRAGAAGAAAGRRRLRARSAMCAARWRSRRRNSFRVSREVIAAVTGTSGKTSVAAFTRQIWAALGEPAASIGTVGLVTPKREIYGSLTTPDPVALHRSLDELAARGRHPSRASRRPRTGSTSIGSTACAFAAGAFTNLSRDHLDYHPTLEAYLAAKLRLFSELIAAGRRGGRSLPTTSIADAVGGGDAARGCGSSPSGARGEGIRLLDRASTASRRC